MATDYQAREHATQRTFVHMHNLLVHRQLQQDNWKKCLGPSSVPQCRARLRWKEIRKSTDDTNALLKCWGTTKAEADLDVSRLVEEGVEPNPGPHTTGSKPAGGTSSLTDDSEDDDDDPDPGGGDKSTVSTTSCSSATLTSVNVRGAPGLWRLLTLLESEPNIADIVCVQEPCVQLSEFKTVLSKFQSLGYKAYLAEGENGKKATGGCITASRATIPHKLVARYAGHSHQHVLLELTSLLVVNSYIPPRSHIQHEARQALGELLQDAKASAGGRPWMAIGDYNVLPAQMEAVFDLHVGSLIHKETRYNSAHATSTTSGAMRQRQSAAPKLCLSRLAIASGSR